MAYDQGFTNKWKNLIIKKLADKGMTVQIGKLTLDPVNGLTARDVRWLDPKNRNHQLASISHLSLAVDLSKVDLGKMLEGESSYRNLLDTLDLRQASLSLPMDPDAPDGGPLEIHGLDARLHLAGNRVDITKAEGNLNGIKVRVRGSIDIDLPPRPSGTKEEMERHKREDETRLKNLQSALRRSIEFLNKFKSATPEKAAVDIDLEGPVANPALLHATVRLHAGALRCGTFALQNLTAEADLTGGVISLRRLEIQDKDGLLSGQAFWSLTDSRAIDFWVDSTVDLHALLKGVLGMQGLGEVVFYQPPHVRADGKILLPESFINPKAKPEEPTDGFSLPLDVVARVDCRKFTSHGVIFGGLHGDFAVKEGEFYARNLQLEHESGTATGQVMKTKEGGIKYHLKWNVSLLAALPFVESELVQQVLTAFEFTKSSYVSIEAAGAWADLNPETWTGSLQADLRNFSYREVPIKSITGDITIAGGKLIGRNIVLQRPDGEVRAQQVNVIFAESMLEVIGAVVTTQPLPLAKMFAPMILQQVEPYVFASPPTLHVDGRIALRGDLQSRSDLRVKLAAASRRIDISVAGQHHQLTSASGVLHWVDDTIGLELTGKSAPGLNHSGVKCAREADLQFDGQFGVGPKIGKVLNWKLITHAAEGVLLSLAGKEIPATSLVATVTADQEKLQIDGTARVYGGGLTATFAFPDITRDVPYHSTVQIERIGFPELTKLYDPKKEAVGELSGFLNFTGQGAESGRIKGTGRIIIHDGDVFAIPLFGPLSKMISTILPVGKLIYSVAREANADIKVENGTVSTEKFEAQTTTFKLLVSGLMDYQHDRVDLTARVNLRGAPGLLLLPVSKLFEYEAQGNLGEPGWHPKYLGIPFLGDKPQPR